MFRTSAALVGILFAGVIATGPHVTTEARADSCLSTDIIDGSDADQAAKALQAAGYSQPHDLKKGCDNYWYSHATASGMPVDVVLPPGGEPFVAHDS